MKTVSKVIATFEKTIVDLENIKAIGSKQIEKNISFEKKVVTAIRKIIDFISIKLTDFIVSSVDKRDSISYEIERAERIKEKFKNMLD